MKYLLLIPLLFFYVINSSTEYLYPIDVFAHDSDDVVLVMHQAPTQKIQLLAWHAQKDMYIPLLSSQYNPTSVKLLPGNKGFSFIDNGLLKVKKFNKRSVHIIEFDKPLYDINYINWIDSHHCYFYAKSDNRYGIYQSDMNGNTIPLVIDESRDSLYPQKIENELFYIERDIHKNYKIVRTDYLPILKSGSNKTKTTVKDFGNSAIAFLSMINKYEGFVIMHPTCIETKNEIINFQVSHFKICEDIWYCQKLFDFNLPTKLFFDNNYLLHEGIVPFLPRISKQGLNFNSVKSNGFIDLVHYDFENLSTMPYFCDRFLEWPGQKNIRGFFAPILIGHEYIYGCMWD